ncbi:S-adenosylmethionine decarboxylase proenzyme [Candidatus Moduliflexus flocculans]|uniref:S-adenosylmethionine decarboxylase proenzyme n=1 Tax=Candidatus Moduliflexus flocculans TaxID=1499966 RepID=A0A081BTA5_9BACT|nr:S-adenosylmethionine decarboxylase proenzyme [Candidatus Moduliflexus flocculans]
MAQSSIMLGQQITASFDGCSGATFENCERLTDLLRQVVTRLGFEEVAHLSHAFSPQGSTCVLILAQSHIIAHTWPEYRALVIDLFACGTIDFTPAAELVKAAVNASAYRVEERTRDIEVERA